MLQLLALFWDCYSGIILVGMHKVKSSMNMEFMNRVFRSSALLTFYAKILRLQCPRGDDTLFEQSHLGLGSPAYASSPSLMDDDPGWATPSKRSRPTVASDHEHTSEAVSSGKLFAATCLRHSRRSLLLEPACRDATNVGKLLRPRQVQQ